MDRERQALDYVNGHLNEAERAELDQLRAEDPELDQMIREVETEMRWVRNHAPLFVQPAVSPAPWRRILPAAAIVAAVSMLWFFYSRPPHDPPKLCLVLQTENPKVQVYLVNNLPAELWEQP
ncbi:MAG: hypothetical protein KDC71_16685 [Acidobacteria bacterium]|nr:hypothetical protein [Acidobacteriota bacterium]